MRIRYRTVSRSGNGVYEEKKSRFLAEVYRVGREEDVEPILAEVRKREYGANHHCYAYVIGENGERSKCSDDGEPQKTAGFPMLSVLKGEHLTNVLVVVSRYFGGTLLGTGGLVRAYESAAKAGILDAGIEERIPAAILKITAGYSDYQKLFRYFREENVLVAGTDFTESVDLNAAVPEEEIGSVTSAVTDLTQGRGRIEKTGEIWIAKTEDQIKVIEA